MITEPAYSLLTQTHGVRSIRLMLIAPAFALLCFALLLCRAVYDIDLLYGRGADA